MRFARKARASSSQPGVIRKKIGASPSGLTTGSNAPTIKRIAPVSWPKSDQIIVSPLLRGFFQMPAESVAHGREQLVLKICVATRTETRVKRRGQHRRRHAFINGRLDRPSSFTGVGHAT